MKTGKIIGSAPILLVADVVRAADYYRDKLGFSYERYWGEPPSFCMPRRDGHIVLLSEAGDPRHIVPHYKVVPNIWNVYFSVDDAEAVYRELSERGAVIGTFKTARRIPAVPGKARRATTTLSQTD